MVVIAGVDEAGRGCVFGGLFLCVFSADETAEKELRKMGVKDSKMLSPLQRERLFEKLVKTEGWHHSVIEYTAAQITGLMRKKVSLNDIEAAMVADALSRLKRKPSKVFVDSPDSVPQKFEKRIRKFFSRKMEFVCENKADANYPVVSAASVIAKVLRDRQIEKLHRKIGDFGSGYTHDPKTIEFLKKNFERPEVQEYLRHEWSTIRKNHAPAGQAKLGEFLG
jgi:ribonuclease HII